MIHRLVLPCLLAILMFATFGCEKQRDSVIVNDASGSQVTWAVMVYASGNYAGDVLTQPIEGTLSRAISTVRVLEKTDSPQIVETYVCIGSSETDGNVGIYRVTYSGRIPDGLFDAHLIRNLESVSMADPMTLNQFMSTVLAEVNAEHYLLALSGDGIGWRGVLGDNIRPEGMSLFDLHNSIELASMQLPSGKFDMLCLYARNMGTIETIAELRDHASYVMASPWSLEQPHSLIINEWYQDLSSQPQMTPASLGAYIIDAERLAQDSSRVDYFSTLWESDRFAAVESAFEEFASEWTSVAPQFPTDVTTLRNDATDENLYNSNFIDLARYADLITTSPAFEGESFDDFRASAAQLKQAVNDACVSRFGSNKSLQYGGLNLYFPTGEVDTALSSHYRDLEISDVAPSWTRVIDSLASRGNSTVTITGQAYWPNRMFENVYFYVDTIVGGPFGIYESGALTWTALNAAADTISYSATLDLQSFDSLTIEFGIYVDIDDDGFNRNDWFGAWNNGIGNFTPFTVSRGDVIEDRNIVVRLRHP